MLIQVDYFWITERIDHFSTWRCGEGLGQRDSTVVPVQMNLHALPPPSTLCWSHPQSQRGRRVSLCTPAPQHSLSPPHGPSRTAAEEGGLGRAGEVNQVKIEYSVKHIKQRCILHLHLLYSKTLTHSHTCTHTNPDLLCDA